MKCSILILISLVWVLSCTASLGNIKTNNFSKHFEDDEGLQDGSSLSTEVDTDDELYDLNGSDEDSEEDEIDDVEEENFNNKKKLSGKSFSKSKPEKVGKKKSGTDEKDETGILDGVGNMMEDFKSSFTDKLPALNSLNPMNVFSSFSNPFDGMSNPFSGFINPLDGLSKSFKGFSDLSNPFSELGKSFSGFPKMSNPFKGFNMSNSLGEWSSSIKNHFGGSSKNENVNSKNGDVKKFIVIEDDDDDK